MKSAIIKIRPISFSNIPLFVSHRYIYTVRNGVYTQCCVSRIICSFTPSGLVRKKHSLLLLGYP